MAQNITLQFVEEKDLENLENVKLLFTEYSNSLNIDLCFQDFNNELKTLPGKYKKPSGSLILAFVDGEYAGNCSFESRSGSRRVSHRAGIGIALYQKYTGWGLGRIMLNVLLREIKKSGFSQAELTVVDDNKRARHLYESLGFTECGRIPNANRYNDGAYSDDILMVLQL